MGVMTRPAFASDAFPLYRVDPARNMARFYIVSIETSLFGGYILVRRYGRIRCAGRVRTELFASWGEAEDKRAQLIAAKLRRGYRPRPR